MQNSTTTIKKNVLVTGATGLIGQWLVPTLLNRGHHVTVAIRNADKRQGEFISSIQHRIDQPVGLNHQLVLVEFDLDHIHKLAKQLPAAKHSIQIVYHLAAAFAWGLDKQQAHKVNVDASLELLQWLAEFDQLERFIWIGGYRVSSTPSVSEDKLYRALGTYEASKLIAHKRIIEEADRLNVPWTALNPSTVIGDSKTGETTQFIGVAEIVKQLFTGELKATPGNKNTFVPLVNVDYVAAFAARVFEYPESVGKQYWLLDENTPPLNDLIKQFASYLKVKAPRFSIPVGLLKRLPNRFLPGSKETLSFLSEDTYDNKSALQLSRKMGIEDQSSVKNIEGWVASLRTQNFGLASTQRNK